MWHRIERVPEVKQVSVMRRTRRESKESMPAMSQSPAVKEPETQKVVSPLMSAFAKLCGSKLYSDVTFVVGDKKEVVPAHRSILAARSSAFEAMLCPFAKEQNVDASAPLTIRINDTDKETFMCLIRCIYTDEAGLTPETVTGALALAKKYHVEALRDACIHFTKKGISPNDACSLYEKSPELAQHVMETKIRKVIKTDGFLTLSAKRLAQLCQCNSLNVAEVVLFKAVIRWAKAQLLSQKLEDKPENYKTVLKEILPHIRFPTMSSEELSLAVAPQKILESRDLLLLYSYMSGKRSTEIDKLPWSKTPRQTLKDDWGFSTTMRTSNITTNGKTILLTGRAGYVMGNKAFKTGKHAWKIHVDSLGAGFTFGVGSSNDDPSSQPSLFGFSSKGSTVISGVISHTSSSQIGAKIVEGDDLHILLDCESKKLTYTDIQCGGKNEVKLTSPYSTTSTETETKWAPHFCLSRASSITVSPIPITQFGQGAKSASSLSMSSLSSSVISSLLPSASSSTYFSSALPSTPTTPTTTPTMGMGPPSDCRTS
eukprot:TRINITY_DN1395_c0_g1_i1.p1 TRINITY_DN1395_c0_g1~~TRINITY_DN1395_c0_g1_i1.p1  ORF type:complete len:542 (-),score=99.07 TRINITY_DN1395_c0_g1_i1:205-1830(-)